MDRKRIKGIVRRFIEKLGKRGLEVEKVILFGSYAHSEPDDWSDIDLLILSPMFNNMDMWERLELLGEVIGELWEPIEARGYTTQEFERFDRGTFIGDEVKQKGIVIFP